MCKCLMLIALALLAGLGASRAQPDAPAAPSGFDPVAAAREFIGFLAAGKFDDAEARFSETVKEKLPVEKLREVWQALNGQFGAFESASEPEVATESGLRVVRIQCRFAQGTLIARIVYDTGDKVSGLWFAPDQPPAAVPYTAPSYVKPSRFTERAVTVGKAPFGLPGTLTLPKGMPKYPAVVLVHGSGPQDRDETVGGVKPFRDLAGGLASNGIAVLRYEKRTKAHGPAMAGQNLTVKEETVDDALAAVVLLRKTQGVDPKRIYVLGHSLGGMLLPRIGAGDRRIAGLISLAGSPRPLEDIILMQNEQVANDDGSISPDEAKALAEVRKMVAQVKDPRLSPEEPPIFNAPASYWLDLQGYHPIVVARSLKQPLLFLQGGRDFQVSPTDDFGAWKNALTRRPNTEFRLYPALNHLFVRGTGKSTIEEYARPGHVDAAVIADIAAWVRAHKVSPASAKRKGGTGR